MRSNNLKVCLVGICIFALVIFGAYSAYWLYLGHGLQRSYVTKMTALNNGVPVAPPVLSGFPGRMLLYKPQEGISNDGHVVVIEDIRLEGWPIFNQPTLFSSGRIIIGNEDWKQAFEIDRSYANLNVLPSRISVLDSMIEKAQINARATGVIDISDRERPIPDLDIVLTGHQELLDSLIALDVIDRNVAQIARFGLSAFENKDTGAIEGKLYTKGGTLYLGPLPLGSIERSKKPLRRQKPVIPSQY